MYARARYKYPALEHSWKKKPCPLDLSGVPMNLPPIPSDKPGSSSRFKGVYKKTKKWEVKISIASEEISLGRFDSEEEAGIMFARARHKYPLEEKTPKRSSLDLSGVPMNLPPILSDRPDRASTTSRFKGVRKNGTRWEAQINIPSEGGDIHLGNFDSEEEAGIAFARARYKYPSQHGNKGLTRVPTNDWYCSSSGEPGRSRAAEATKPTLPIRNTQCAPGEVDRVDGITIEAFSGPTSGASSCQPPRRRRWTANSQSRPKKHHKSMGHFTHKPSTMDT